MNTKQPNLTPQEIQLVQKLGLEPGSANLKQELGEILQEKGGFADLESESTSPAKAGTPQRGELSSDASQLFTDKDSTAEIPLLRGGTEGDGVDSPHDHGFKVFKLSHSNFKQWQPIDPNASEDEIKQQFLDFVEHIDPATTSEYLLYEILLKSGFSLTEKIEVLTLSGKKVYSIGSGGLLICLEDVVTKEMVEEVIKLNPVQFVCLDSGFNGNDQLKANVAQTLNAHNQNKDKLEQIIFKTV
ncbi:MAG: hypothetical protein WCK98_03585 [bacterium]